MSRYYSYETIRDNAKDVTLENGVKHRCIDPDALLDIEPADVRENVKGEWIEDNSREKSMMWRCSVCGQIAYYPTIGKRKGFKKHCGYNFCPNCGADMRGERT